MISDAAAEEAPPRASMLAAIGSAGLATAVLAIAIIATVFYPPLFALFALVGVFAIVLAAPKSRATPRRIALALIFLAALLLPLWPIYLHVKLGPLPILTPPRLVLYALTAVYLYDMAFSPLRRGQFLFAARRSGGVVAFFMGLFVLGLISLPLAEGRSFSIPEFFRQSIIWLLPFCAVATYLRRQRELERVVLFFTIGALVNALIALAEVGSGTLLATLLSPFIPDNAEWLQIVQAAKVRDGIFRAQATHTHPLSLGEFLAMMTPFAFVYLVRARTIAARLFWASALIVIPAGAFATNSRAAMLVAALALGAVVVLLVRRALRRAAATRWRPLAGLASVLLLLASPALAVGVYGVVSGKGGVSAANSSQARVDQIEQAWPKIMKRPVLGHGAGRAARILGYWGRALTIDNYYLTLALDYGLPGPIVFGGLILLFGAGAMARAAKAPSDLALLYLGCVGAAIVVLISRSTISQTGNLAMIYMLIAAYVGAGATATSRRRLRREFRSAHGQNRSRRHRKSD